MRICHVNLADGFRGGERQTELLVRELQARGICQRVIVRKQSVLAQRLAGLQGVDLRQIARPFLLHAGHGRGWLLHAHESKAAHFAHACHILSGADYLVTRRVDNRPSRSLLTRDLYRRARRVVAISAAIKNVLQAYDDMLDPAIIPSVQARLVAKAAASAEIKGRWPGKFIVGHIGALDNSQKGQLYIIRAARRLALSHPQLQFVLLGDGKDADWLRREAEGLPNLSFVGYQDNVGDWLGAFDLFILPSLHEGLGSTLLDAMSFGLPVVATRVDGIPEIVKEGENGLLVPPADDDKLAVAIGSLCVNAELRRRLGVEGRRIATRYTPAVMADAYLRLYRDIHA